MLTFLLGFLLASALFEALFLWKLSRGREKETAGESALSPVDEGFENIMRFSVGGETDV